MLYLRLLDAKACCSHLRIVFYGLEFYRSLYFAVPISRPVVVVLLVVAA